MIRKVLISSVYAVIITVFGIVSCTDVLDQVNPNSISGDTFWRNADDAIKAVGGLYHGAGTTYDNFGGVKQFVMWRTDAFNYAGVAASSFRHSSSTWVQQRAWDVNYAAITQANEVIKNVPTIEMDLTDRDNITGEGYFIRAWAHFELVMMFENIVLRTSNPTSAEDLFPSQRPSADVYAQIISDLEQAEGLLQPKGYYATAFLGRADRGAATALKGKAYLYTQQWSQAASTFQGLMNSGQYSLVANYRDNFREDTEFNDESIYELPAQDSDLAGAGGWLSGFTGGNGRTAGFVQGGAYGFAGLPGFAAGGNAGEINRWVLDEYLLTPDKDGNIDLRAFANIAWNHPNSTLFAGQTFENKYGDPALGNEGFQFDPVTGGWLNLVVIKKWSDIETRDRWEGYGVSPSNWRAIRYADVLLMYAEAQNEAGGPDASVYAAINQVRARANMPDITAGLSQGDMRDAIRLERTLELFMEGHRFQDLRRWGTMTEAFLTDHPGSKSLSGVEFVPGRDELMPIPQHEIDANANIVQNPGFTGG